VPCPLPCRRQDRSASDIITASPVAPSVGLQFIMSASERSPLLSNRNAALSVEDTESLESTPLLSNSTATPRYDGTQDEIRRVDTGSTASQDVDGASTKSLNTKPSRWPSIIAMIALAAFALTVMTVAFFVPAAVEDYAKQALVIEPTNLALESITADGVRARVQANFRLDGQRVQNEHVRRVGRVTTWLVGRLGTKRTKISVYLTEYDNILLGTASVPPLTVSVQDGHNTAVDFVADLVPGNVEGIRTIANEWLEGRLDVVRLQGKADVELKAGIIPLGTHTVSESLTFEGQSLYRSFASLYFGQKTLF